MLFHESLKKYRNQSGLTQLQLAEKIGVAKSTIAGYENGSREPDVHKIKAIASALAITGDDLLGTRPPARDPNIHPYHPTHRIPILGRVAAGLPIYAEEHIEGYTYTELNGGAEYFALRVVGDSMTALHIIPGCLVIVRKQEVANNGAIAVVLVDEEDATVKKYRRDGNTVTLYPQSLNSSHEPQTYNLKAHRIRILGIIVKIELSVDVL